MIPDGFMIWNILKFLDIVEFKTAQFIYKARNNLLPRNIQKMFKDREGRYGLRRELNLKQVGLAPL